MNAAFCTLMPLTENTGTDLVRQNSEENALWEAWKGMNLYSIDSKGQTYLVYVHFGHFKMSISITTQQS